MSFPYAYGTRSTLLFVHIKKRFVYHLNSGTAVHDEIFAKYLLIMTGGEELCGGG